MTTGHAKVRDHHEDVVEIFKEGAACKSLLQNLASIEHDMRITSNTADNTEMSDITCVKNSHVFVSENTLHAM